MSERDGTGLVGTAGLRPAWKALRAWRSSTAWPPAPGARVTPQRPPAPWSSTRSGPLGLPEVLAEVDEGNAASVAVVKRLGMTAFGVVPGVLGPMTRYRRTARSGGTPPGSNLGRPRLARPPAVGVRARGQRPHRARRAPG